MALKKCKECGNSVSTKATACPSCGAILKRKTGCFTWLVFFGFLFFLLPAMFRMAGIDTAQNATVRQHASAPIKQQNEWTYSHSKDEMGKGNVDRASIQSTNEVDFAFPYAGPQRATITVRRHSRLGNDVMFSIKRGQLLVGSLRKEAATVRFDDADAIDFAMLNTNDNDTITIFFEDYLTFYRGMQRAKRVRISMPVHNEGNPVFDFDVSKFEAEKLDRPE